MKREQNNHRAEASQVNRLSNKFSNDLIKNLSKRVDPTAVAATTARPNSSACKQ